MPDPNMPDEVNEGWGGLIWQTKNDHGLWCNFCGELLRAPWDDNDDAIEACKSCGAPDFEDGMPEI